QVLLALTLLLIYLSHPVTFGLTIAVLGVQWLLFSRKRLPALLLAATPSVLMLGFYAALRIAGEVSDYGMAWYRFSARAEALLLPFGAFRDPKDNAFVFAAQIPYFWAAIAIVIAAGAIRRHERKQQDAVMVTFAVLFIAAALLCPSTIIGGQPGAMRIT